MTEAKQPEALRLAEILEGDYCPDWFYEQGVDEVAAELRRQHARIAELEAQLEAIGAGGVSGPLMGCTSLAASAGSEPVAVGLSDPFDALRWGANVAETLLSIGRAIGFGRAQQILGEQWEAAHDCAPRGRMGVTVKDEATCQMCGGKPYPGCNTEFQGEAACRFTHPSPPEGAGWISVDERLPEWAARDDTPCFINGKEVPPTLTSETVLVALKGGGVRTDKLTTIEGKSAGWWHTYGERVVAWQKTPAPPASEAKGASNADQA